MNGTQLTQFSPEVLHHGAETVLPQNLSDRWLEALMEEAERLEVGAGDTEKEDAEEDETLENERSPETEAPEDDTFAGLRGAVLVLLMVQQGHPNTLEIATRALFQHMQLYAMALAAESVRRWSGIWVEPPTVANIFDPERAVQARRRDTADA